jgi:hypothetical protein
MIQTFWRWAREGPESSADDVIQNLQAAMLLWQKSLEVTGGSLRADKCSWGVLAYEYKQGNPTSIQYAPSLQKWASCLPMDQWKPSQGSLL